MYSGPIFGVPAKWEQFVKEYPTLAEKLGPLHTTLEKVFIRRGVSNKSADHIVFFLGRLCAEDFYEILLMCGNGYGFGAMRLLRSMYERAVTMAYIAKNPTEADDFWDYHHVTERKILNRMKDVYGEAEVEKLLGKQAIDEIEKEFKKVKPRFVSGGRLQISWTKKTMEALVKAAGKGFEELYLSCYVKPLLEAHPSVSSIMNRVKEDGGAISFDVDSNAGIVVWPLINAHNLVLRAAGLHNDYFKLGLDDEIKERANDFMACWNK